MRFTVPRIEFPSLWRRLLVALVAAGLIAFLTGVGLAPRRAWPAFLIAFYYITGLGLGAAFFIASQYVTGAGWSVAIRRIPEAMTGILPVCAVGVVALAFGLHSLYEWAHGPASGADAEPGGKELWLSQPFFIIRLAGYFVLWIILCRIMVRSSRRQDEDGDVVHTLRNVRNSVVFLILGAYSGCLASVDLLMSLQPHWSSTIFGFLSLSGVFLSSLAFITVFVILLRRMGCQHLFTADHLSDLGRLLLAFSVFWVYIWVCQHLLIWYTNIPEETSYYAARHRDGWGRLSVLNVVLNWLLPFLLLLSRAGRRSDRNLLVVSITLLIGHWLDLYITVMPATLGGEPKLGVWEIGPMAGAVGVFCWVVLRGLGRQNLVPIQDPLLVESLHDS